MRSLVGSIWNRFLVQRQRLKSGRRLRNSVAGHANELKIIIGASGTAHEGWISTEYPLVDITDARSLGRYFSPGLVAAVLAEHVWEHLTPEQSVCAARNLYALLRPDGYLRIAVPDGNHPDPAYIEYARPGGSGAGSDDHKVFYTHDSLSAVFTQAGFDVTLLEWFDAGGTFHAEPWDPLDGMIERSARFDARNHVNPTAYTSAILDAVKPQPLDDVRVARP